MKILFFLNLFFICYVYLGYPLLLLLLAGFKSRKIFKSSIEPKVSLIISAFNEEKNIKAKILNILKLDYPKNKLEVIVASDASTDRTNDIVNEFSSYGVKLLRVEGRLGKTEVQNQAVEKSSGEIIIFSILLLFPNRLSPPLLCN